LYSRDDYIVVFHVNIYVGIVSDSHRLALQELGCYYGLRGTQK
jgi:hypothetical protein